MATISIDELDKHVRTFYEGRGPDVSSSYSPSSLYLSDFLQQKNAQLVLNQVSAFMVPVKVSSLNNANPTNSFARIQTLGF
jgi:hypothetical protein